MDSVLRQSKAVCPFLKKSSPATLRALSTVVRPQAAATAASSPCGGTMSKLQLYANRCPIMGKAIAVRSAHYGRADMPKRSAVAGLRAFNSASKAGRAGIHTSRPEGARLEDSLLGRAQGKSFFVSFLSWLG